MFGHKVVHKLLEHLIRAGCLHVQVVEDMGKDIAFAPHTVVSSYLAPSTTLPTPSLRSDSERLEWLPKTLHKMNHINIKHLHLKVRCCWVHSRSSGSSGLARSHPLHSEGGSPGNLAKAGCCRESPSWNVWSCLSHTEQALAVHSTEKQRVFAPMLWKLYKNYVTPNGRIAICLKNMLLRAQSFPPTCCTTIIHKIMIEILKLWFSGGRLLLP